jgi:uncharacterized protein
LKANATINLPLHGGHAPPYLIKRMVKLSHAISKVIVDQYGEHEFLRRLSDPLWFQAFGCVLGFDWHSSGVTTVVTGVLKQALTVDPHGICSAGGKGRKSRETYSLYHHVILFDKDGDWTVVQQGMNPNNNMARRYHWISDTVKTFVSEPHSGIICASKNLNTLNMTSIDSEQNQKISVELARGNTNDLMSSVMNITKNQENVSRIGPLDNWITGHDTANLETEQNDYHTEYYEMPRRLNWNLFRKIYEIQPTNYEQLISIPGFGPAAVRALSLIGEIIFGTKASWQDPVKFNFAHGGKDGVPYPVARKTYDKSISYLSSAIEGAEIQREERIQSLKKLAIYSARLFPRS